jgi:hypothetical protein
MPHCLIGGGTNLSSLSTGTAFELIVQGSVGSGQESRVQYIPNLAGTFSNFGASLDANGTARSMRSRKNTANANALLTFPDSTAAIVYDNTNTDHINGTTDKYDLTTSVTTVGSVGYFWKMAFSADGLHASIHATPGLSVSAGTTTYWSLGGQGNNATESVVQTLMRTDGTWQNLCIVTFNNTVTGGTMNATARKNGIAGNQTVSMAANATGFFYATQTDAYVSGDLLDTQLVYGGSTGTGSFAVISMLNYDTYFAEVNSFSGNSTSAASASNQFFPALFAAPGQAESIVNLQHGFTCQTSNFRVDIDTNTTTGPVTWKVRKNLADGLESLIVPSGSTGWFEDISHQDSFNDTDTINYASIGGTSGAYRANQMLITESTIPIPVQYLMAAQVT